MKISKAFLFLLTFMGCFFISNAHTYWIQAEGSHKINEPVTIKIYFGEYSTGELMKGKALDKMKDIKIWVRYAGLADMPIIMTQDSGYWKGDFTPGKEGSYEITGLNDTREVQDWNKHGFGIVRPIQYLKYIYQVGNTETAQSNNALLDVGFKKEGDHYNIRVFKNGQPASKTAFFISQPDGEELRLETNDDGNVSYKPTGLGLYIIGIEWVDKTPGSFLGKEYASIRHRLDASFIN